MSQNDRSLAFKVRDIKAFEKEFPVYQKPLQLGCYSIDGTRQFHLDRRNIKYLFLPRSKQIRFDLRKGYKTAIKKEMGPSEQLDSICQWLVRSQEEIEPLTSKKTRPFADFVCYRGLLTKIMCAPYENRDGWIICAIKFRGTIYLCSFDTPDDVERRENATEREKEMTYWGFKFEQYLVTDDVRKPPNPNAVLNEYEEYCSVLKTRLNNHRIVFGGEVDCVDPQCEDSRPPGCYVELKTNRIFTSPKQETNFYRFKAIKWWAQSFLIGIPRIVCGLRNDSGVICELRNFRVGDLAKSSTAFWRANVCTNFLDQFLDYVKRCVDQDNPEFLYKFDFNPGCDIKCTKLGKNSEFYFLRDWFFEEFEDGRASRNSDVNEYDLGT